MRDGRVMRVALSSATATAMSSWLAPPLLPAVLVMVSFALIPSRRRVLIPVAVIAWAAVWIDNRLTADLHDIIGVLVAGATLAVGTLWPGPRIKRTSGGTNNRA